MVTYEQLKQECGNRADDVAAKICAIHGGLGLMDFKVHRGGLDISGCSKENQAKIAALIGQKSEQKEGK